jgi:hypothetical protein
MIDRLRARLLGRHETRRADDDAFGVVAAVLRHPQSMT